MLYHIGSAHQRGDHPEAAILEAQLEQLDREIDVLEERMKEMDSRQRGTRARSKLKV